MKKLQEESNHANKHQHTKKTQKQTATKPPKNPTKHPTNKANEWNSHYLYLLSIAFHLHCSDPTFKAKTLASGAVKGPQNSMGRSHKGKLGISKSSKLNSHSPYWKYNSSGLPDGSYKVISSRKKTLTYFLKSSKMLVFFYLGSRNYYEQIEIVNNIVFSVPSIRF